MSHLMKCSNGHLCRTSGGHLRLPSPPVIRTYSRTYHSMLTAYGKHAYDLPADNGLDWDDLNAIELSEMPLAIAAIADGSVTNHVDAYGYEHILNYSNCACCNVFSSFGPDLWYDSEAVLIANASGFIYQIACTNDPDFGSPILASLVVTKSSGPANTVFDVGTTSTLPTLYSGFPTNIANGSASINLTDIALQEYLCIRARWGSTSYPTRVWYTSATTSLTFGSIAESS